MKRETFWLIENTKFNSPAFYSKSECYRWTPFCDEVVRYETKEDAEAAMSNIPGAKNCIVTEHSVIGQ